MEQGGRAAKFALWATVIVGAQVLLGTLIARGSNRGAFIVLGLAVAALVFLRGPAKLGVMVFPAVYLSDRFGAGGLDLSLADVALVIGVAMCALQAPWANPVFRRLLIAFSVYMTLLAIPLAVNPTRRAILESFHRLFLVIGAVCVGAAVAKVGWARIALVFYLIASAVVSGAAVQDSLANDLLAGQPWGINKNAGGFLVVCAITIALVAKPVHRLWGWFTNLLLLSYFAGALAFQSRGAVAALAVVFLLAAIRMKKRSLALPVAGIAALAAMARATTEAQEEKAIEAGTDKFTSVNTRIATYEEAVELWRQHRWFGSGIRFWNDPAITATYFGGEPHNLFVTALGESGVFGAVALAAFLVLALWALRGPRSPLWLCARYLVIAQVISGMLDIYWRAGTGTLPWLVVGLAVGTAAVAEITTEKPADAAELPPPSFPSLSPAR